jgi:hypothetical protein
MYAEVIFEPGSKSVLQFDSEDELKGFLEEHHRRALAGEDGGPTGHAAERISRVIVYKSHPGDYAGNAVSSDNLKNLLDGMTQEGGVVDGNQLMSAIRDEMSPVYPVDQGRHESIYKMEGQDYDLSFLGGDKNAA